MFQAIFRCVESASQFDYMDIFSLLRQEINVYYNEAAITACVTLYLLLKGELHSQKPLEFVYPDWLSFSLHSNFTEEVRVNASG